MGFSMVITFRSVAVAAMMLMVSGGSALAEGDLFIRELSLTPEQVARHAPRPADPFALEEALAAAVLREGNARRAEVGLRALDPDPGLADAARRYSQKMRDMAFFAHDAPDGESLAQRLPADAKYRYAQLGENLWSGQGALDWRAESLSAQATEDWILSPSHRDNLLEPVYDVAGVGVAVDSDRVYITMLYARPQIDAASARLASAYSTPPTDLYGLTTGLERSALQTLNIARGEMALPSLAEDVSLAREARLHAQATLAAGGMSAAAREGDPVLRRVLDDPANRTSRLTMLVWEAKNGVVWQGDALARAALASWRKQGASMEDVLTPGYTRAGIGAAADGTRVFLSVLLSETSDPTVQLISQAAPVQAAPVQAMPLQVAPPVQIVPAQAMTTVQAAPVEAIPYVVTQEVATVPAIAQPAPYVEVPTVPMEIAPEAQVISQAAPAVTMLPATPLPAAPMQAAPMQAAPMQAAPYVQMPAITTVPASAVERVQDDIPFVDMQTGQPIGAPVPALTGGAPLSSVNGNSLSTTVGGNFVTVQ